MIVLVNPSNDHEKVNIYFLYGFSSVNVLVDAFSSYMFLNPNEISDVFLSYHTTRTSLSLQSNYSGVGFQEDVEDGDTNDITIKNSKANLNMISAFTHLSG